MSVSAHLTELKKKHESLGLEVEKAQRSPGIDDLHIAQLKKLCRQLFNRHRLVILIY